MLLFNLQEGATALHIASQHGHVSTVQLLVEAGASLDVQANVSHYTLTIMIGGILWGGVMFTFKLNWTVLLYVSSWPSTTLLMLLLWVWGTMWLHLYWNNLTASVHKLWLCSNCQYFCWREQLTFNDYPLLLLFFLIEAWSSLGIVLVW